MVTVAVCILPPDSIDSTVFLPRPIIQSFLENIKNVKHLFSNTGHLIEHLNIFAYFKHVLSVFSVFVFLCVCGSQYTVIAVYVLDSTHPLCVIGQNISF